MNSQFNMQGNFNMDEDDTFIVGDRRGRRKGPQQDDDMINRSHGVFAEKVGSIIGPTYISSKRPHV